VARRDPTIPADHKRCPKCGLVQPRTEFYSCGGTTSAYCKACYTRYAKQWRAENREHHREYRRELYQRDPELDKTRARRRYRENPEAAIDYAKRWQAANAGRFRETNQRWKLENWERLRELNRRWKQENPEAVRVHSRRASSARRARERDAFVEDVDPRVVFERDGGVCQLCHEPVDPTLKKPDLMCASTDHVIPLSRGGEHSYANTQLAHLICNIRKNNRIEVKPLEQLTLEEPA
jgi:hypothetical protein